LCGGGPCAGEAVGGAGVVQDLGQVGEHTVGEVVGGDSLGLFLGALGVGVLGVAGVVRGDPVAVLGAGVLGVDGHLGVVDRAGVGLCRGFGGCAGVCPDPGDLGGAACGEHELVGVAAGDLLDGVGDGPVGLGGAAVGEHTDDVGGGGTGDLGNLHKLGHPMLPSRAEHSPLGDLPQLILT